MLLIEPFKINLTIVAAFLTIVGYSVNDTIVVFDRIREVRGKDPNLTRKMVNDSTNQTLSRTLLTSLTVLLVVVVLVHFRRQAMHGLAFALIVGVVTGTYSSIYVAAPILLWLVANPPRGGADGTRLTPLIGNIPLRDVLARVHTGRRARDVADMLGPMKPGHRLIVSCGGVPPPDVSSGNLDALCTATPAASKLPRTIVGESRRHEDLPKLCNAWRFPESCGGGVLIGKGCHPLTGRAPV